MSATFQQAAAYLSNAPSASSASSSVKLELYSLYKYLTVSPQPTGSRPSIFDITGRAKWDAWKSINEKVSGIADAEQRYIQIAESLGWRQDEQQPPPSNSGGTSGFGLSVSVPTVPAEQDDGSLHFLALNNDTDKVQALLRSKPDLDLNSRDEYGYTALHLSADRGNLGVVKLLLELGADRTIKVKFV